MLTPLSQHVTPRLKLRLWQQCDRDNFAALNADPIVMRCFPAPFTRQESDQHFDRYIMQQERDGFTMYAAEDLHTGQFYGVLGMQVMHAIVPNLPQPAVELGWRLMPSAQGKGLATEGAIVLLEYAFHVLHLSEIVAITTVPNLPSRRVMEKLGMRHRPELDFEHPSIPADHPLCKHVLYSKSNPNSTVEQSCIVC